MVIYIMLLVWAGNLTSAAGDGNRSIGILELQEEIHTPATQPLYLVWFVLDSTAVPRHNPASLLLRAPDDCQIAHGGHWGKQHAIFARMDGTVYQPGVFRTGTLAARTSLRPQCRPGILPDLRKFSAGGSTTDRAALAHEAATTGRQAAIAPETTLDFIVSVAP
jgi:hypothetical protein